MKKEWIKISEAAKRYGCTRGNIYERIAGGAIPKTELKTYPVLMINWNYLKMFRDKWRKKK